MPRRVFRTVLAALVPLLLATAALAAPKWHTLQAPHALIVSQLSERETREWATRFEQFTAALRDVILIDDRFLPPLTVVLFADSGTFAPYRPLGPNGKKRDIAGFFASRETWGVIGLAESFSDEATRQIVLHEATHWLISATPSQLPLWLNEGFAEVFSSFEAKKDHALLGEPIPYHVETLRKESWVPLLQIMLTDAGDRLYTDNIRNRVFYAESWLFVHRLLFQDRAAGFEALNRFFNARQRGADQLTAFEAAFGKGTPAADSQMEDYLRNGRFSFSKLPFPPNAKVTTPFAPAAPLIVETALARLALTTNRGALARTHLDRARALDPSSPLPYELTAMLEYQTNNQEAAVAAARQAIDRKTSDAWMYIIAAQETWRLQADRGTLDTAAREIADHYARAIALQPKLRNAYCALAALVPSLPTMTDTDLRLIAAGFKTFPDAAELLVGLAHVAHKDHDEEQAQRLLTLALAHPDNLNEQQRIAAEALQLEWAIQPRRQRIEALAKEHNYRAALAESETLLKEPMPYSLRNRITQDCRSFGIEAALQTAAEATVSKQPAEAVSALEAQLARSDLSQWQRDRLQKALTSLKGQRTENDIFARWQAIQNLNTTGHRREAVAACDAILTEDLSDGWRTTIVQLREQSLANVGFTEAQMAADAGHREEAIRLLEKLLEEDRTAGKETTVLESILSALRQNRPWPEIYRTAAP